MNRLLTTLLLLFTMVFAYGQDITKHEADSLLQLLSKTKPGADRIHLLLQSAEFQIFKAGENKADLDSAATFINEAKRINTGIKSDEVYGYMSLLEARLSKEKGQEPVAREMLEKAIQIISKGKDKFHLGKAYFELSQYYDYNDPKQILEKIRLAKLSVQAFQQSGNIAQQAFSHKFLADLYNIHDEFDEALKEIKLSLEEYKSINFNELQGVYDLLGYILLAQKDYKQALTYELIALKTAENVQDTSMQLCEINNHIGITYMELSEPGKAIIYFKNAIKIAAKYKDNTTIYFLTTSIVYAYLKQNKAPDALLFLEGISKKYVKPKSNFINYCDGWSYLSVYTSLKQFRQAQPYCNQLLGMLKNVKMPDRNINGIYAVLIDFYIASKEYVLAQKYLIKHQVLAAKIGKPTEIQSNYNLWIKLDTAQKNYKAAFSDLVAYHKINDSLFNETKSRQMQQIEVQYETEKKENEIKSKDKDISFLNQKNQLQQRNLQQANLIKDFTFAGIVLLIIIIALLYKQYRHKQQSNRVITHKNELLEHLVTEKEWLLKEVHHRVKNNLHTVICLLESQADYLENDALKAIETSQHRIYAMSLIHQKLYQSEEVKAIDMAVYVPEFIEYLKDSFGIINQIQFKLHIEPLELGISQAIPIALIINEAVTNAIKYAFPGNKAGIIKINMFQVDQQIQLTIADNGIGINTSIADNSSTGSLGLELMRGLSEDINASIKFENDHGTKIIMIFNVDEFNKSATSSTVREMRTYA